MPRTKTKPKRPKTPQPNLEASASEVLTLAEAAAYLRVPEDDVVHSIHTQKLPARQVGTEWRFSKQALGDWLRNPGPPKPSKEAVLARIGSWKDDPDLDEMLKEIYKRRGRPMTEEGE